MIFHFDWSFTYAPICSDTLSTASETDKETVGSVSSATVRVKVAVLVPMVLLPFLVVTVMVQVPLILFGICVASSFPGVQVQEVPADELMVPVLEPNFQVTVWVKELSARGRLIVKVFPIFKLEVLSFGMVARGIVSSLAVPEAVPVPGE